MMEKGLVVSFIMKSKFRWVAQ